MKIYLDNAATTPLDPKVLEAMMPYLTEKFGNPSAIHAYGREVKAAIEKSRKIIASYLNASTGEVFFTSGGTESNNWALKCSVRDLGIKHIISSPIEHHTVLHSMDHLSKEGVQLHYLNINDLGHVDMSHLEELLSSISEQKMVSLMHANNEIGTMIDLDEVSALCQKYNALLHSDTVQTISHYKIDLQKTKLNFITGSAHKFHGPKGIGFIYINSNTAIKPLFDGGSQERNMRAGTENVYGIIGMAKAFELAMENLEEDKKYITDLKYYMMSQLEKNIPGIEFYGDAKGRSLYTVLNVAFPKEDTMGTLLFNLDMNGICCSSGSACTSGSENTSHVISALNKNLTATPVRFSFSHHNTKEEIDFVVTKLKEMVMAEV